LVLRGIVVVVNPASPSPTSAPDASLFESFYLEHRRSAVRLAWLLTHDRTISEDIAHDAFAAVFTRFDGLEQPGAYLRRCVINGVYERSRRLGREQRRNLDASRGQPTSFDGPTGGILDAIRVLTIKEQTAIVLRYWAGLRDREIADAMDMRAGAVRSVLSRALTRLRKEFES
jgi:DNA-directed RNA polymerase specialized sigma24 family protein